MAMEMHIRVRTTPGIDFFPPMPACVQAVESAASSRARRAALPAFSPDRPSNPIIERL